MVQFGVFISPACSLSVSFVFRRALADILRQQGPVPISQYEHENLAVIDGSPKDETPVRTSKNHYTPVHGKVSNHGRCLSKPAWCRCNASF